MSRKQMIQRIINLDVFRFHFEVGLNSYRIGFLIINRKLLNDDHTNQKETSSMIHSAEIIVIKDNSDCLLYNIELLLFQIFWF